MDNETNDKLNETLGKMGVMDPAHAPGSSNTSNQASDKSFYLIMLAIVVGMGFYVSYDMNQRYDESQSASTAPSTSTGAEDTVKTQAPVVITGDIPVVINVDKTKPETAKPVSEIPAPETTATKDIVDEKVQQTPQVSSTVPVEENKVEEEKQVSATNVVTPPVELKAEEPATAAEEPPVAQESTTTHPEVVAAPVVEEVPAAETTATTMTDTVPSASQPVPDNYYPYGYYRRPYQGNYYQQPRNPYYQNRYPYPYGYGYGSNPYQQPATAPVPAE